MYEEVTDDEIWRKEKAPVGAGAWAHDYACTFYIKIF